ncbi:DegT/DnrJ/EryC1/StrS family aminotransferase [Pseudomonadota bacterium]
MIPVNEPLLVGNEKKYLVECIETGWVSSDGPFVKRLESDFSKKVSRNYGVAVCNGSAALEVALASLEIGRGDEVIVPTFTIISCVSAIIRSGATPVLIDCDPNTWNMDVSNINKYITSRTKAIMIVHIYGLPTDIDPVLKVAKDSNLFVIEDAAQMLGQSYKGRPCGSFGDISTFSFYANKHITTGEGGILVTDNQELAERCRSLRNLCFNSKNRYVHQEMGWNFRISNLQAAVGVAQLECLDEFMVKKRSMGEFYTSRLSSVSGLQLPVQKKNSTRNIYWAYSLVLDDSLSINAAELMRKMADLGVGTRPFFWPMHKQPVFQKLGLFKDVDCPVAERISSRGLNIPSGLALTKEQMDYVCNSVELCLG